MSWFERQRNGRTSQEVNQEHGSYIRAAGLNNSLEHLAGPFGSRRFIVHFERQGARVLVSALDAVPLQWGGGPPADDPSGERMRVVEKALQQLHQNMATGPAWEHGAIGFVRDGVGRVELFPLFGEDASLADLGRLPLPGPPGHPLEDPATLRMRAEWESRVWKIRERSNRVNANWDGWEVQDDRTLLLHFSGDMDHGKTEKTQKLGCQVLATFNTQTSFFQWRTGKDLFDEPLFRAQKFPVTWGAAMEVCLLSTARLGAQWLFVQEVEPPGSAAQKTETKLYLMVAVHDG